ncbi:hypothetical protein ACFO5Q_14470 [Kordiimonas lipolytica]|uniref:Uncharacterized protein n=1 Tax=Kordiimonas lipolytica TaxID=1662421 RepID=A0ABV8UCW3_9PROT|nr:hypothetical protein [Kordiimonas lipolytica]
MVDDKRTDEQGYTDPETGKPIIYADNVPELLRGDLMLSPMRQRYAKRLDEMTHLERAKRGKLAWNSWVIATADKWLTRHDRANQIEVVISAINWICFEDELPSNVKYISHTSFAGYCFPCNVSFQGITFNGKAAPP